MLRATITAVQRRPLVYPFLFAIYPILFLWSQNIEELSVFSSPIDLLIPMAISILFTLFLLVIFWVFLRDWRIAGLFAAFVLLLFFSYGHILQNVSEQGYPEYGKNRYFVILWPVIFVAGSLLIFRFRSNLTGITNPLNVGSLVLVMFTLPSTLGYKVTSAAPLADPSVDSIAAKAFNPLEGGTLPDIYYITAEGYSSARTLQQHLDYDNSPFINYLERNNFFVASETYSNYPTTNLSLASALNMQTFEEPTAENEAWDRQDRLLFGRIRDSKAMRFARQHGYKIVYLSESRPAGSEELGDIYYGCRAMRLGIHREGFVDALLMTTALNPVLVKFNILESGLDDRRSCHFFQLAKTREIPGPKVVVVHLEVPGYPFVIGPNGESITKENGYTFYREAFLDQVTWTNSRLQWLIDLLLSDPEYSPVIVLQGDHGESIGTTGLDGDEYVRAAHGILNAYHLPGDGKNLLYPSISPVNTFRIIFDYYFGADFELLEDKVYRGHEDVTDRVRPPRGD